MRDIKINSQDVRLQDLVESIIWEFDDQATDECVANVITNRRFMKSVKDRCLLIVAEEGAE